MKDLCAGGETEQKEQTHIKMCTIFHIKINNILYMNIYLRDSHPKQGTDRLHTYIVTYLYIFLF